MTSLKKQLIFLPNALVAALLSACGGGGGGSAAVGNLPVLSGTAAVGAPLAGATITVSDAKGVKVGEGTSGDDGLFAITLSSLGTAPYVLKLTTGSVTLHAIHGSAASGDVNITPVSEALVAMLSPTGAAADLAQSGKVPDKATIESKQEVLTAALSGVASAANTTDNIFTKKFAANGSGSDKVLESIAVSAVADGSNNKANVQISLKLATDPENANASLSAINLTSDSNKAAAETEKNRVGPISSDDLPDVNAGGLYKDLLANLNACYKEAPLVRTDGDSAVRSDTCRKIFLDSNPAQYLNFGQRLGKSGQFSGMFTYAGQVTFQAADKPYLVQDLKGKKSSDGKGRAIVSLSWLNEQGNRENIMLYVTKYSINGKELLGLSGDRNQYGWTVNSHNQKREFPLRSDTLLDYVTSSYLVSVRDVRRNGNAIDYVEVMPNEGKKFLMAAMPGGAARDLAICKSNEVNLDSTSKLPTTPKNMSNGRFVCTGNSKSITFSERFVASTETRMPSDIANVGILRPLNEAGLPYTPTPEVVKNLPNIRLWTIVYKFAGGDEVTQKTWSVARPLTTDELMGPDGPDAVMPRYTEAAINAMKTLKTSQTSNLTACLIVNANCDPAQSPVPAPSTGGYSFAWTTGNKVPVTSLWASGYRNSDALSHVSSTNATAWDDQWAVSSTTTSALVRCSRQSESDAHCAAGVLVGGTGDYHAKTWMSYSEMWGKDTEQRTHMRSYNWFQARKADLVTPF